MELGYIPFQKWSCAHCTVLRIGIYYLVGLVWNIFLWLLSLFSWIGVIPQSNICLSSRLTSFVRRLSFLGATLMLCTLTVNVRGLVFADNLLSSWFKIFGSSMGVVSTSEMNVRNWLWCSKFGIAKKFSVRMKRLERHPSVAGMSTRWDLVVDRPRLANATVQAIRGLAINYELHVASLASG